MSVRILCGDVRDRLAELPDESVHCVVTSPPYWGLRNYAMDGQIGLEATVWAHLDALVEVFREVRRVLRADGTVWLNYGDAYAGSWGAQSREHAGKHAPNVSAMSANQVKAAQIRVSGTGSLGRTPGLKAKDRMLLPARVAIALCDDGWWVRDEIVWSKPNPMPAPQRGRTTPAHEMLYMLSKSDTYHYDHDAIAEPIAESSKARYAQATIDDQPGGFKQDAYESGITGARARSRRPNEIIKDLAKKHNNQAEKLVFHEKWQTRQEGWDAIKDSVTTRIKRSVWVVPTEPLRDAHFATFPTALIEPCILAGCPKGGTVLDPFGGAGTTGLVADRHGRNAILIELNPEYAAIAERRIAKDSTLFADVTVEASDAGLASAGSAGTARVGEHKSFPRTGEHP